MAYDFNTACLGDFLGSLSTSFPVNSVLRIRTGTPAGVANTAGGTELWAFTLGASPWAAVSGNSRSLASVPLTGNASGTGTAGHFRLTSADGTRVMEGTVGLSGADWIVDSVSFTSGQSFSANSFTVTATDNQA
jgi:hypothetical protein